VEGRGGWRVYGAFVGARRAPRSVRPLWSVGEPIGEGPSSRTRFGARLLCYFANSFRPLAAACFFLSAACGRRPSAVLTSDFVAVSRRRQKCKYLFTFRRRVWRKWRVIVRKLCGVLIFAKNDSFPGCFTKVYHFFERNKKLNYILISKSKSPICFY
jgi:hypothetical protein